MLIIHLHVCNLPPALCQLFVKIWQLKQKFPLFLEILKRLVGSRTKQQGSECRVGSSQWACVTEIIQIYISNGGTPTLRLGHQTNSKFWTNLGQLLCRRSGDQVLCGQMIGLKVCGATPGEAIASTDGSIQAPSRPPDGSTMVTLIGTGDYVNWRECQ